MHGIFYTLRAVLEWQPEENKKHSGLEPEDLVCTEKIIVLICQECIPIEDADIKCPGNNKSSDALRGTFTV